MAKAISDLKSKKNNFDMLIEIVDARAINISSNKELLKDFNLPVLTIAVKSDVAEINQKNDLLYISTKNKSHRQIVLNKIREVLKPKIDSKKKKGLVNPQFNILVLGLPNIGKSSFINFLLNKNNLIVQNYPGVTRKQTLVKIDNMLFLNDSPGILFKKIDDLQTGYILGLIGCIKKDVLPMREVIKFGYEFYLNNYQQALYKKFNFNSQLSFDDFINHICQQYKFIKQDNQIDTTRAFDYLYGLFMNGSICKVNYEK